MNEPKELIPAYLQATKVIVGFCMYAIPASDSQWKKEKLCLVNRYQIMMENIAYQQILFTEKQ